MTLKTRRPSSLTRDTLAATNALGVASPMPCDLKEYDRGAATRFVDECLCRFYKVSVNDGEEWTVIKSDDRAVILAAMGSTDMDHLAVHNDNGERLGRFDLVWGNGPGELFADCTNNPTSIDLVERANEPYL